MYPQEQLIKCYQSSFYPRDMSESLQSPQHLGYVSQGLVQHQVPQPVHPSTNLTFIVNMPITNFQGTPNVFYQHQSPPFDVIGRQESPPLLMMDRDPEKPIMQSRGSLNAHTLDYAYRPKMTPSRLATYDPCVNYRVGAPNLNIG